MSTATNQKPMWRVSFGQAPGRCHVATWTLTFLDTSAPLRKCKPHGGTAARPPPLPPPPLRPHSALAARPLSPAAATCDTLSRVTPFRGARRASACLPSSGRSFYHHPAPPRPSVKRATSPLPPVDRPPLPLPHLVAATPPPPVVPDHHVRPRGRFVGLACLELAWRSTRTVYSSSPPALPPAPSPSSSDRAPGRAGYCIRPFHSRAAVPSGSPNRTPGRSAGNGCYREYETQQAHRLSSARSRTTLRHPCVRPYISASCTFTGTLWVGRLVLGGGLGSAFGSCAFVDPLRVCFVDALWPRHGGPQCCHSTVAVA